MFSPWPALAPSKVPSNGGRVATAHIIVTRTRTSTRTTPTRVSSIRTLAGCCSSPVADLVSLTLATLPRTRSSVGNTATSSTSSSSWASSFRRSLQVYSGMTGRVVTSMRVPRGCALFTTYAPYTLELSTSTDHYAQSTFCVNSLAHWLGDAPFDDKHTPRDHIITAFVTIGEGYHNFHHQFPMDYRNAIKSYQYDPTKWVIWTLSKLGLASHLKVRLFECEDIAHAYNLALDFPRQ
jgi:hypothetical protein